jgi:hypothetical protein
MLRIALVLLTLACPTFAADTVRTEAARLRFAVPAAWTRVPAPSDFRAAQWKIPHTAEDKDDGSLVLYFFGEGKGGGVQENLDRWYGQFTQPDGRPSKDAAVITMKTVNGLRVTAVDLSGSYEGMAMGGGKDAPKAGYRMLAAVIEGEGGPWFWKTIGPEATMAAAKSGFDAMLASLEAHH